MEVARHWRLNKVRYQLQGSTCPVCGTKHFPARPVCTACGHGAPARTQESFIMVNTAQPAMAQEA
ncbi:MAG: hypothetical protein JW750_07210 [Anaerolineaceae bacterium]|nr:hypothetical protein [Anaerolineaceae bacterium]